MDTSPPLHSRAVSSIMTKEVLSVTEGESLYECRHLFSKHDFHHIPVTAGDRLVGIISVSDLVNAGVIAAFPEDGGQVRSSFEAAAMSVTDAMRREPVFIGPDDTIGLAASMLAQGTFHALPVVDGDKLVGMLTTTDLLQLLVDN